MARRDRSRCRGGRTRGGNFDEPAVGIAHEQHTAFSASSAHATYARSCLPHCSYHSRRCLLGEHTGGQPRERKRAGSQHTMNVCPIEFPIRLHPLKERSASTSCSRAAVPATIVSSSEQRRLLRLGRPYIPAAYRRKLEPASSGLAWSRAAVELASAVRDPRSDPAGLDRRLKAKVRGSGV